MATAQAATSMTMMDLATMLDPSKKKLAKIVECLNKPTGEILAEAPFLPSNDTWTHKSVRAASMPSGSRRRINKYTANSTARETPVLDVIAGWCAYAQYDRALIDNSPEPGMTRIIKSKRYIQGIGQSIVSDILYGDTADDPDGMQGLAPRLDTCDGAFVIDGGGSSAYLTDIFVVTWGEDSVHLIYPANMSGTELGVRHEDKGQVTDKDSNGYNLEVYKDYFEAWCGLVVADPRCVGRISNIETVGADNRFDEDDLITLLGEMETGPSTRIYMNQTILTQARIKLKDKTNMHWTSASQAFAGLPILEFDGIPVRKIDKSILLNTNSAIS